MWNVTDWQKVMFSDESRLVLGRYHDLQMITVYGCGGALTLLSPARSPDLSPVEYVWDQLKRQMPSCHSVHDLELAVQDLWAHLPQDNIRQFCENENAGYVRLLPHTEVSWLSKGNCLKRFVDLYDVLSDFLSDKPEMKHLKTVDGVMAWLCDETETKYPHSTKSARKLLLPFPSSYLAEWGFSAVNDLLSKKRNRLHITKQGDLRLKLTNLEPDIKSLCCRHNASGSH
ncbi:SCAN domain-containing protein 3 [Trichonephila clavipes]|nr:SCAN domain-containing protein 3 [Trichonephila clavipes]